jgi:hypothetical protein
MSKGVCFSIVGDRFVSTIYRQSSACICSPPWYYETIIFKIDPEKKREPKPIHMMAANDIRFARKRHWQITESLLAKEGLK